MREAEERAELLRMEGVMEALRVRGLKALEAR
jgi:hypothetical protein